MYTHAEQVPAQSSGYRPVNSFSTDVHKMLVPEIINSLQIVPEIVSSGDYNWHHAVFVCSGAWMETSGEVGGLGKEGWS